MIVRNLMGVALAALAVGACHQRSRSALDELTPVTDLHPAAPKMQFAGRFSPVLQTASGQAMAGGAIRITGTVRVTGEPGSDDRFTVETEFTTDRGAEELLWSIVAGPCGSPALPLVSPHLLSPIEVSTDGRAHATLQFRSVMSAGAAYHLNLYADQGVEQRDVIGCANLKRG